MSERVNGSAGKSEGKVEIKEYFSDRVKIITDSQSGGILTLADNYYPGWEAFIDETKTEIIKANYTLRAVNIPPGNHELIFKYQPVSFRVGLTISVIGLAGWLLAGLLIIIGKRKI